MAGDIDEEPASLNIVEDEDLVVEIGLDNVDTDNNSEQSQAAGKFVNFNQLKFESLELLHS